MASNNYISANVVPSSDTFREWVDLTNRITFDMEKVVVTTLTSNVGGGTTGNAYVNGFFSANTLMVTDKIQGAKTDDAGGEFGANAASANIVFSTNAVFESGNSTVGAIVHAQSNVHLTGNLFQVNVVSADINSNLDIDNAITDITSTNLAITGTETNIDSNTVFTANVNIHSDSEDLNIGSDVVTINTSTTTFQSNAGTNIFNTPLDINANVDVDNALTDITSTNLAVTGTNTTISSNLAIIGNTTQLFGNNVFIGNANTDMLNVASNTFLLDTLDVAKASNFQDNLTVAKVSTLNGNVILGSDDSDLVAVQGKVTTHVVPFQNGVKSVGTTDLRFDGFFDDLDADDLNVLDDATIGDNLDVVGAANVQGSVTLGSDTSDIVRVHGLVNTAIVPDTSGRDLGTTAKRWDAMLQNANTSQSLLVGTTSTLTGAITGSNTINITGAATFGNTISAVNSATFSNTVSVTGATTLSNTLAVTNTATFSNTVAVTGAATLSNTLAVTGTSTLTGDVTAVGNIKAASANVSGHTNVATIGATGAADFDNNLTVEGTTSLKGDISLGDATGDTITVGGRVGSNWNPSANNSKSLGLAGLRWKLNSETINNSKVLATGNTTVTGFVNVVGTDGKLDVAQDSTFNSNVNLSNTGSLVFSNTGLTGVTKTLVQSNLVSVAHLNVTGSAVLPEDTTLTASDLGTANLIVTDTAKFTGSIAGDNFLQIGEGSNVVQINAAAGLVISDWKPQTSDTVDLGISGKKWRNLFLSGNVSVGNVTIDQANVTADNIIAKDDLIAASSSDNALKDKVMKIDTAMDKVELIGGYEFVWNNNIGDMRAGTPDYGVIAQEIENVLPHAVDINSRGYKTVNYNSLIPLLIEAVKELSDRVKELEPKVEEEDLDG